MQVDELARVAAGLPVAVVLPLCLPVLRERLVWAVALSAAYAALTVAPMLPDADGWLLLAAAPVATAGLVEFSGSPSSPGRSKPPGIAGLLPLIGCAAIALLAIAMAGAEDAWTAVESVIDDNDVSLVVSAALSAVFIGGAMVAWALSPFTRALADRGESLPSLENAGLLIGWFERSLFFAFLVAGEPQAAAIALAAKSFARFPSLSEHKEGFAEYFLIGTLASLVVALIPAMAVRAALGLPVL